MIVGQELWWVPNDGKNQRLVTVLKVGRKWAELSNARRIDISTLCADGGGYSSPGRCHTSREEYEQTVKRNRAWSQLKRDLEYKAIPDSVTTENIIAARKLLGMED